MSEQTEAAAREAVWAAINAWATEYQKGPAIGSEEAHKEWVLKCVALAGFIDDALDAYRTTILGSQAALVEQLTEALQKSRHVHAGDSEWTLPPSGECQAHIEGGCHFCLTRQMCAVCHVVDEALAAADAQKSADARREE